MQAVSKNPRDALVVAKVLRRTSSLPSASKISSSRTRPYLFLSLAEELELEHATAPDTVSIDASYNGPHIQLPIDKKTLESLILAFQRGEV